MGSSRRLRFSSRLFIRVTLRRQIPSAHKAAMLQTRTTGKRFGLPVLQNSSDFRVNGQRRILKHGSVRALPDNPILFVHQHNLRIMRSAFFLHVLGIAADDDQIADMDQSRRGTVETDHSGAPFAGDRIGRQAVAVIDVVDVDLFPFHDVGRFHQQRIDRDAAFIVQTCVRHRRSMDFRFEQYAFHESLLLTSRSAGWNSRSRSMHKKKSHPPREQPGNSMSCPQLCRKL